MSSRRKKVSGDEAVIGFGLVIVVVLYFIVMFVAYTLAYLGVGIVMSLDFVAYGFRWLGVSNPAVGWLLLGVFMGGSIGLAQGLKRSGRQADTIKVYLGAAALACTLSFVSFLAVSPPASRALPVPTPSARPPTRETPSPTPAPPTGARSGAVSLPSPPAVPLSEAAPGYNDVRQMVSYAMTKGGVDHEADIAAAKRRLEAIALKRQSDPGRRKQARDTNGKGLEYIRAGQWSEAVRAFQVAYTADPTDVEIINNLGYAHLRDGNAPAAEPVLLRALIFAPGRSSAWANLGETYAKQGNLQAAVACFANAYRFSGNQNTTRTFLQTLSEDQDDKVRTAARQALQLQLVQAERQQLDEERRREEYQKLQAEQERLRQERERLQGGGAPKGPQVVVGGNPPAPATPQTLRTSIGRESAPPAVTVELSSPTPEVTFQPQQRFQEIPGKKVKITASKKGYVTAEKTILVADHDMSEVLGPLQRQAELEQGEIERRKRQAEETERRRREAEQADKEHQRQAEETERWRREAEQAEQRKRETILVAQGMKFIVKRQFLCLNTQDSLVVGSVTLTGASSLSCEDARRTLIAEEERKNDCPSPYQKEGQKQWIGTASCPGP